MRQDMSKVIVERARVGHSSGEYSSRSARREAKQRLRHGDDDLDSRCSIKGHLKHPKRNQKELNENLKPLIRFLRKNVGRPWNDVFSEICQNINTNSACQLHIRQHLDQFVETNIKMKDGKPYEFLGYSYYSRQADDDGYREMFSSPSWGDFYVNPDNGKLEEAPLRAPYGFQKRKKVRHGVRHPSNRLIQWHQINGIWYEFKFRNPTKDEKAKKEWGYWHTGYDPVDRKTVTRWHAVSQFLIRVDTDTWRKEFRGYVEFFGAAIFPIAKRQINSQEIKKVKSLMAERRAA